jgi:hypothetical protein
LRSTKTSISLSTATWNAHGPSILKTFKRIGVLTKKVTHTEYVWVREITNEISRELEEIRIKLDECALGSPEEDQQPTQR